MILLFGRCYRCWWCVETDGLRACTITEYNVIIVLICAGQCWGICLNKKTIYSNNLLLFENMHFKLTGVRVCVLWWTGGLSRVYSCIRSLFFGESAGLSCMSRWSINIAQRNAKNTSGKHIWSVINGIYESRQPWNQVCVKFFATFRAAVDCSASGAWGYNIYLHNITKANFQGAITLVVATAA